MKNKLILPVGIFATITVVFIFVYLQKDDLPPASPAGLKAGPNLPSNTPSSWEALAKKALKSLLEKLDKNFGVDQALSPPIDPVTPEADQLTSSQIAYSEKDNIPPSISMLEPRDLSYTLSPQIKVRIRSEPGCHIEVNTKDIPEVTSGFYEKEDLALQPGLNRLQVLAMDPVGNRRQKQIRVTYIPPSILQRHKKRFLFLLQQLDESRSTTTNLNQQISELIHKIETTQDSQRISRISQELYEIKKMRVSLELEVEQTIKKIDRLLDQ